VAVGDHKAIAVKPLRIGWIVTIVVVAPQRERDFSHAHRHARVTGIGFLDGIHRKGADDIGEIGTAGHECFLQSNSNGRKGL